jgi:hypothetical protein
LARSIPSSQRERISPQPKFEFRIPTTGKAVPAGAGWFHEIKYDGYRLRIERDGDRVRLITRGGCDWTRRFPWIAEAALRKSDAAGAEKPIRTHAITELNVKVALICRSLVWLSYRSPGHHVDGG